jgi:mannitol/fructose-specific phosphotransferase system IIA component (Ntr-type)
MIETRLSAVLTPDDVALGFSAAALVAALPRLLEPAFARAGLGKRDRRAILDAIAQREASASTISPPLALPHARHERPTRILAALALNRDGILVEPAGVQAIVAFVSPAAAAAEHLRFLSGVARLFRSGDVLAELTAASTPLQALAVLRAHAD